MGRTSPEPSCRGGADTRQVERGDAQDDSTPRCARRCTWLSSIHVCSPATNFQFESHFAGVIAARAGLTSATCLSNRARSSFLFVVPPASSPDSSQAGRRVIVCKAQSPFVSETWPASLPSVIDLACGFQWKSASSGNSLQHSCGCCRSPARIQQ